MPSTGVCVQCGAMDSSIDENGQCPNCESDRHVNLPLDETDPLTQLADVVIAQAPHDRTVMNSRQAREGHIPLDISEDAGSSDSRFDRDVCRSHDLLVVFRTARLPERCVMTNHEAHAGTIRHRFSWRPPRVYSWLLAGVLPAALGAGRIRVPLIEVFVPLGGLVAFFVDSFLSTRRMELEIPISHRALKRRTMLRWITGGFVTFLVAWSILVATVQFKEFEKMLGFSPVALLAAIIVGIVCAMAFLSRSFLRVYKIEGNSIWLKGAHRDYLDAIPDV